MLMRFQSTKCSCSREEQRHNVAAETIELESITKAVTTTESKTSTESTQQLQRKIESNSMSSFKKPKTDNGKTEDVDGAAGDEFEKLKRYLMECPHISPEHPALKGALEGLERERQRRERDAKLQRKFAASSSAAGSGNTSSLENGNAAASNSGNNLAGSSVSLHSSSMASSTIGDDVVVIDQPSTLGLASSSHNSDPEMNEWQDVADVTRASSTKTPQGDDDDTTSFIGEKLAKVAIDAISEHQVKVKSPVAAIAAALHASLRSDVLGFACTGIPEDSNKGGFAAPIRELPKTQFFPNSWDKTSTSASSEGKNKVSLRYRKKDSGARILVVQEELGPDNDTATTGGDKHRNVMLQVNLSPTSTREPGAQSLRFPLEEHVNLDSWNAAQKSPSVPIAPALHYKGLVKLLTRFCRSFDLGSVDENTNSSQGVQVSLPYIDNTIAQPPTSNGTPTIRKSDFVPPKYAPIPTSANRGDTQRRPWDEGGVPATIGDAFPGAVQRRFPGGDFAGDLAPGGLIDPQFGPAGNGRMGGNLLGPNHPMFRGGDGFAPGPNAGIPMGGPGTMQPRFDPIYPPGVHDPDGRGVNPPNGSRSLKGDPNPDHLRPPSSFGHDMFS